MLCVIIQEESKYMSNLKCFNEKNEHNGKFLQEVFRSNGLGFNSNDSVKWCPICGAVVVDTVGDNRTRIGHMRFPEVIPLYDSLCK